MLQKFFVLAAMALVFNGSQALAAKAFPTTWTEFGKMSQKEMKSLPDMKWAMDKVPTADQLKGMNEVELALYRNSIYAQTGFHFTDPTLVHYFATRSWYKPATEDYAPLSERAKIAAHMFMQAQSPGHRGVADDGNYSPDAFDVFQMGFCTYDSEYHHPAGMIVFEAAGVARLFHSVGSDGSAQGIDKYSSVLDAKPSTPSRLINAKWSVGSDNETVYIDVAAASIPAARDEEGKVIPGKYMFAPGKREVLKMSNYQALENHRCSMKIVK